MSLFNQIIFSQKTPVVVTGGGITKIFDAEIGGTSGGCTTTGKNTAGSTLFVGGTGGYRVPVPTISDSKVNSWTGDTGAGSGGAAAKLWYVGSPLTDSNQTFSANGGDVGTTAYSAIGVIGVSGATTQDGSDVGATGTSLTPQPGSITPSQSGELFVTILAYDTGTVTWTIDSGFTILYQGANGNGNGFAIAYKIKTDATAENPKWTKATGTGVPGYSCRMAAFK